MKKLLLSIITLIVASVHAEAPFCALRFGAQFTAADKWPSMYTAIEQNRAAFDEVWFSTGCSFPKLAWHENHARECAKAAADLRKLGIVPSIEIQTIIGHTDEILGSKDCSGQDWGTMVSADGLAAKWLSCPGDPKLMAYFVRVAELNAAWHPGSMWIDDDMSFRNRAPVLKSENRLAGCFCDRCIAKFGKVDGRDWKRDELAAAIRADAAVRKRWDDYSCGVMGALTRAIAEAVHRISPETVMGYQYGGMPRHAIPYGLYEGSQQPIRLRPGAGQYWDSDAHEQIAKAYTLQRMLSDIRQKNWIRECCPEIESCPRTFACRTAQGIILESFENLAMGMDFISMFIAGYYEPAEFYGKYVFPQLAAAHPFLKSYREANRGTKPCGFTFKDGVPSRLVATRGIPILGLATTGKSLGEFPDLTKIVGTKAFGGGWSSKSNPESTIMQVISSTALTNLYAECDRVSGGKLPVVFDEPVMCFAMPHLRADDSLATLAIVNATIGRQDSVGIKLRRVPPSIKRAVWHQPEASPVEIALERRGEIAWLKLPRIEAWQCGYLELEIK